VFSNPRASRQLVGPEPFAKRCPNGDPCRGGIPPRELSLSVAGNSGSTTSRCRGRQKARARSGRSARRTAETGLRRPPSPRRRLLEPGR
jgi:hypothetical protein